MAIILVIAIAVVIYIEVTKNAAPKKRSLDRRLAARDVGLNVVAAAPAVAADIKPRYVLAGPAFELNEPAPPPLARSDKAPTTGAGSVEPPSKRHAASGSADKHARREALRAAVEKRFVVNTDFTTMDGKPLSGGQ